MARTGESSRLSVGCDEVRMRDDANERMCSFLRRSTAVVVVQPRPVSPGVSRSIIKQRPDGPLAHYHIHEHGKCIRSDTPGPSSFPRRALICGLCLRMPAAYIGALRISYESPRDYPGGHPPPPSHRRCCCRKISLIAVMHFRAHRRNSFIHLALIGR